MQHLERFFKWRMLWLGSLIPLLIIFAACSNSINSAPTKDNTVAQPPRTSMNSSTNETTQKNKSTTSTGPQYLIKTLKVSMEVKNTRKIANDLQNWISNTDHHATSSGMDYELAGNDLYNITMTFSVQASIYPKIQQYLENYPSQHEGRLLSMIETVQDVTNSYVDTQSRLNNLRAEQTRLRELLSRAQNLNDILTIEQRLTNVESQIESTEAQLNTLTSQVTFFPITITLQPIGTTAPPPPPGWSAVQVLKDAFATSIAFGQGLVSFLIWLLAFSIYIIPAIALVWFIRRWLTRSYLARMPKMPPLSSFPPATPDDPRPGVQEPPVPMASASGEESTTTSTDGAPSEKAVTPIPTSTHY